MDVESPLGTYGVHTHSGMLTWWFKPAPDSGNLTKPCGRSFANFLRKGPALDNAPAEIVEEIAPCWNRYCPRIASARHGAGGR
jgi:hypothetical protein